jgi:hypothetical protein
MLSRRVSVPLIAVAASILGAALWILLPRGEELAPAHTTHVPDADAGPEEPLLHGVARTAAVPRPSMAASAAGTQEVLPPRDYTVRDLATGSAVAGVPFKVAVEGAALTAIHSDSGGRISVPGGPGVELSISGSPWRGTWAGRELPAGTADLWVFHSQRVRGRVVASASETEPLDASAVRIQVCMVGVPAERSGEIGPDPWNSRWARAHGLWDVERRLGVATDGGYEVEVPRVRGAVVRATAPGWMPGWTDVPNAEGEPIDVPDIILKRALRVRGQITDEDGAPLRGVRLSVLLTSRYGAEEPVLDASRAQLVGWSLSARGNAKGSIRTFLREVRSDEEGNFSFEYGTDGELLLVAEASGRWTVRQSLGLLRADPPFQSIRMRRGEVPALQFHDKGKPLAGWKLTVADLMGDPNGMEPQPSSTVKLSADGHAPGTLMERGRDYYVWLTPPDGTGVVQFMLEDWDGDYSIDAGAHGP